MDTNDWCINYLLSETNLSTVAKILIYLTDLTPKLAKPESVP